MSSLETRIDRLEQAQPGITPYLKFHVHFVDPATKETVSICTNSGRDSRDAGSYDWFTRELGESEADFLDRVRGAVEPKPR